MARALSFIATSPRARDHRPDLVRFSAAVLGAVFVVLVALCAVDAMIPDLDDLGLDGCCGIAHCSSALLGLAGFVVQTSFVAMRSTIGRSPRSIPLLPLLPPPEQFLVSVV
jgi:hypothetical protein